MSFLLNPLLDAGFFTLFCLQLILTNLELFGVDPLVMPWSQFCTSDALLSMLGDPSEPRSLILPRHSIGWIINLLVTKFLAKGVPHCLVKCMAPLILE